MFISKRILFEAMLAAAGVFAYFGCSNDANTSNKQDQCDELDCSGHGQCAVLADGTPICVCDPGYHSADLDCAQDQPGQECDGVTCSGHGSCLVVQADAPYPVCMCDEGFHVEANTNCIKNQGQDGLSCGQGTHEENGVCVSDDSTRPDDFCVPDLVADPGSVVIESMHLANDPSTQWASDPYIAWTGDHFVGIYFVGVGGNLGGQLVARSIDMDGSPGAKNNLGMFRPLADPATFANNRVAILVEDSNQAPSVLLLDDTGALKSTISVPDGTKHLIAFKAGFAVLHGDSLLPIAADGTKGSDVVLADQSGTLGAAAYDANHDQIGFAYTTNGTLTFSVAKASDFTVLKTDTQFSDLQDLTISYSNPVITFAANSYLLQFDARITDFQGLDTVLHAYQADGTERVGERAMGAHLLFMNQLIDTGRFAMLLGTLGNSGYYLFDTTGRVYPDGLAMHSYHIVDHSMANGGVAYSDKGVAVLTVCEYNSGDDHEVVFSRFECQ